MSTGNTDLKISQLIKAMTDTNDNNTYTRKRYIFDEYFDYHKHYTEIYGPKTVVFFELGSFYCIYGVDNETTKLNEGIVKITELLHITLTRADKSIVENDMKNPLMCGIPNHEHILSKYLKILVQDNNYTVIKINQKEDRAGKMSRKVSKIYSPSTYIEEDDQIESNYLMGIYFDNPRYGSVCIIDLGTGSCTIYEPVSQTINFLDEVFRFRKSYKPKEYIINFNTALLKESDVRIMLEYLEFNEAQIGICHVRGLPRKHIVWNLGYQNEFLLKVYPKHQFLSPIEYIDLEKNPISLINLIRTIEFAYEHDDRIVHRLAKPTIANQNNFLVLETKSIDQLNLISDKNDGKFSSVLNIIDNTKTASGRRKLKAHLITPVVDVPTLEYRYGMVEAIIKNKEMYNILSKELSQIVDLDRRHRKMAIGLLNPAEFYRLDLSYKAILRIIEMGGNLLMVLPNPEIIQEFKNFINEYTSKLDLIEIQKYHLDSIKGSFLNPHVDKNIDILHIKIKKMVDAMKKRCKDLSEIIGDIKNPEQSVTLEYNSVNGYYFKITKNRYNVLTAKLKKAGKEEEIKKYEIKKNKNDYRMTSNKLKGISNQLILLESRLEARIKKIYIDLIKTWGSKYSTILQEISDFIATIDVFQSHAYTAQNYGYVKPIVEENNSSFIEAKQLRNPIAERINTKVKFVPNDVSIGTDNQNGILLFSVNGCGKSTLLRSVASSIILAQIGCYVPCTKFRFSPFKNILTRIGNQDNIFKSQSTFQIEMLELRTILNRADMRSMVITDELCSGTENSSATAIMAAAIIELSQRKVNFMFATHLHNLNQIMSIHNLQNVKTFHLKVEPHAVTGELIYNRRLTEGPGDSIYGLEIAKYILQNPEFIKTAMDVRKELLGIQNEILNSKKRSKYNKNVYTTKCEICSGHDRLETHHIQFQCTAIGKKIDSGTVNIHHEANLVILCTHCHLNVHNEGIKINGWKESIESGRFLDYTIQVPKEKLKIKDLN
jgi:DNA mismatch repair protein MutS